MHSGIEEYSQKKLVTSTLNITLENNFLQTVPDWQSDRWTSENIE